MLYINAINARGAYATGNFSVQPQFNGDSTGIVFQSADCTYTQIGTGLLLTGNIFFSSIGTFSPTDIFSFTFSGFPIAPENGPAFIGNAIPSNDMTGNINFVVLDCSNGSSPQIFYLSANPKIGGPPNFSFDTTSAAVYSDFTDNSGFVFNMIAYISV